MQTLVNLVSAGLGLAWVPASVMQLQRPGVVYRPLAGDVAAVRDQPGLARAGAAGGAALRRPCAVAGPGRAPAATIAGFQKTRSPLMLVHPQFDPVALQLGPVADPLVRPDLPGRLRPVPVAGRAARALAAGSPTPAGRARDIEDLLFYGVLGVVLGGRLGYVLFYKPGYYAAHPLEVLAVWKGGMSFHGGLLGVLAAMALFARSRGAPFLQVTDLIAPCVPTGPGVGAHRQLHQRRAVGPCGRPVAALGDGVPAVGHRRCRATRRSCTSSRSKACCCSCCCGGTRSKPRRDRARCRARS